VSRFGSPPAAETTNTSVLPSYWPVNATWVPSGENRGEHLEAGVRREPAGRSAADGYGVEVARVRENDLIAVNGGEPGGVEPRRAQR